VFGRFNPPTTGHKKLFDMAKNISGEDDMRIYPSRSQDPKKNPLDPGTKIKFMKQMFADYEDNIVNEKDMKTIFDVLTTAEEEGYKEVKIVVGSDRLSEFKNLATKYNGELYNFDMIDVLPAGERDSDAEGVSGMSASKLRKAVKDDDMKAFTKGMPSKFDKAEVTNLYNALKKAMGLSVTTDKKDTKESFELWEIAPSFDYSGLREKYYNKEIFKRGDVVESMTTGLRGKVTRRGANHLICVTESGIMFKSWIKDVSEAYTEKKKESIERVPGKPNTLVGTGGYKKYVAKMTPGSSYGKEFINKYKAKK
jgi:nicotinamide mononucleotide adenylyltransferase